MLIVGEITEVGSQFRTVFPTENLCNHFDENGFGYILDGFLTNSSVHSLTIKMYVIVEFHQTI
jgi:hypothetical protein